jgi:uncharacterized membrane protein YccC
LLSGFDFRDWLLANDPALSRLRMASRVTLSVMLSFGALMAIHALLFPLPYASYGLAIVLAIEGGVAVRDKDGASQLLTRLLGCAASLVVVAIAAGLEGHRYISDGAFLIVIFSAASARVFGVRGHAIGMFAFMSYFMGAYLKPPIAELPLVAIGPVVSSLIAHVVRSLVLPEDWRRDLLRALESVQGRINQILFKIAALAADGGVTDADRQELNHLEERLKEVVLMAESFIPRPPSGLLDPGTEPAGELAIRLFDAHLAAESAIMLCAQSLPSFALVHKVIEGQTVEQSGGSDYSPAGESRQALIRLGMAQARLGQTIAEGRRTGFADIAALAAAPASPVKLDFSLRNPLMRSALQITLASAIAMTLGLALSRDRWFWAVLASFLVFTNANSRGDTAMKALQRSLGTLFGIGIGLLMATVLSGHLVPSLIITGMAVFLAFYFLQTSYATMTFFVSIALCLIYGMIGLLTLDLLLLRIEETALGAAIGTVVAFVVFPARTRGALDVALDKWFASLDVLLRTAASGEPRSVLIALSQTLDACYRDLATTARPLGSSWSIVTKPGHTRQTLAIFLAATYWARIIAKNLDESIKDADAQQLIKASLLRVELASKRRSECFFIGRKAAISAGRHHPHASTGWRHGLDMIGSTLDRLYPDA